MTDETHPFIWKTTWENYPQRENTWRWGRWFAVVGNGGGGEQCGNVEIEAAVAGGREFGCVCVYEREKIKE